MLRSLARTFHFIRFTLIEYRRSGRIMVDVVAGGIFFYVFLMMHKDGGHPGVDAEHFFTMTGIFTLVLSVYTMSATLSLGDRPLSYMVLSRKLGRSNYLIGLYFSALLVVVGLYVMMSVVALVFTYVDGLSIFPWVFGSIPLILNIALFMALLLLLSPMVFPTGWRLFVLSLFALAFSGNFFTGAARSAMPEMLNTMLSSLQTILSWPLVPAFSGFALSVSQRFDTYALVVIIAQVSLLISLLGLAIFAFSQREIIFGVE